MPLRPLLLSACCLALIAADPTPPPGFSTARPQVTITTSKGVIVAELFADQAPVTVRTVIELAEGLKAGARDGETKARHYYDGLTFHRCIPNFMIQGGCPQGTGSGDPGFRFADEINADSLGLADEKAIADPKALVDFLFAGPQTPPQQKQALMQRALNPRIGYQLNQVIQTQLLPAAQAMGFDPRAPKDSDQATITKACEALADLDLKTFLEGLGYRYDSTLPVSTKPNRGVLAMANSGPNTNGSQFFINVADTPHLTGKHTVFGRVISGMDVADAISTEATGANNRPSEPVVITSIRLTQPATTDDLFVAPADQTEE